MKIRALLPLVLSLGSCAVVPPAVEVDRLFADHLFRAPSEPVDAVQVLAASEAMKRYLAVELGNRQHSRSRQQALIDALRDKAQLKLEYDAAFTRNAAQAFEARTGNCLSLVIMTAAFAREMGVPVRFQSVFVEETWSRRGDVYFSIGHVNLTLGGRPPKLGTRLDDGEQLTVDFLPPSDLPRLNWRVIDEKTVLAMYMNNRAAEAFAAGKVDDAYWFARAAIQQDPAFVAPHNTLGVIFRYRGHLGAAARVFAHALEREPRNTIVMANLVPVLASLGRRQESQALERRLAELDPEPAFAFFHRGVAAMREGDFRAARDLFAKEVGRAPYNHEFHFWLAQALAELGKTDEAKRHLELAMENSTTRKDHDLYAAKLDRFTSLRLH